MEYVSWSTEFDNYRGSKNWQELPLDQRRAIVVALLDGEKDGFELEPYVMKTGLRRIQFDGLATVITRTAVFAEHEIGDSFLHDGNFAPILPYLTGTAIGRELGDIYSGLASEETSYRMGELEFLAQTGSRPSPLDKLTGLPNDLKLQGLRELLKPDRLSHPGGSPALPVDPNSLPFDVARRLHGEGKLRIYAGYSGSLAAARHGLVNLGGKGTLGNAGFLGGPLVGLVGAFFWGWWLLPLGLLVAFFSFRFTRKAAAHAVIRDALKSEQVYNALQRAKVIDCAYTKPISEG